MAENDMLELPGLRVEIDDVVYQPQFSMLADQPHCFVYKKYYMITILLQLLVHQEFQLIRQSELSYEGNQEF